MRRRRHGRGTRRNFKFDEEEESIYLDVCLPGETFWHKILPYNAKRLKDEVEGDRMKSSRVMLEGPLRSGPSTGANEVPLQIPQNSTSRQRFDGYT